MQKYKQLTYEERIKINQLIQKSYSITRIAYDLGRSKSTISRELTRNEAPPGEYWPDTANALAHKRRRRGSRIDKHLGLRMLIREKIKCCYWTPEIIAGYLKCRQKELPYVSHETIYKWIYDKRQKLERLWTYLPRHKAKRGVRKRRRKNTIPNRLSIHKRPFALDNKRQFGHWEGDLMCFQKGTQHMLVLRERKTMMTLSTPLPSKNARHTAATLVKKMMPIATEARKTLTLDNGGEFAKHELYSMHLKGLKVYFCDPYASWQKGGIENTNGRLRRDLPRNTNIKEMKKEEFDEILENYNNTPRKNLKWLTPLQAFKQNLKRVALQT